MHKEEPRKIRELLLCTCQEEASVEHREIKCNWIRQRMHSQEVSDKMCDLRHFINHASQLNTQISPEIIQPQILFNKRFIIRWPFRIGLSVVEIRPIETNKVLIQWDLQIFEGLLIILTWGIIWWLGTT